MQRTQYTVEFKPESVKHVVDKGHSAVDVAKRLEIGKSHLHAWVRKLAQFQ